MTMGIDRLKRHLSGVLWALVGCVVVYGGIVVINEYGRPPAEQRAAATAVMQVSAPPPPPPPPKKAAPKPRVQPRVSRHNPPPAPIAGLTTALSGIDFGIPEFRLESFDRPAEGLLGDTGDVTMTGETADIPPRPERRPPLPYPKQAKKKGIQGYVVLNLLIDERGSVVQVQVLESQPVGVFDQVASDGVKNWLFQPARYQGKPVRVWAKQKIAFELS
jgi:protein TonB